MCCALRALTEDGPKRHYLLWLPQPLCGHYLRRSTVIQGGLIVFFCLLRLAGHFELELELI